LATTRTLSRNLLADQVKDRLLEAILSGEYLPDSRIVETQIARELNTSQAPVREALRALEALGVVEITPFKGARVRRPARREILEAYAVRSALESLGAQLAVPRLTDADLSELAAYITSLAGAGFPDYRLRHLLKGHPDPAPHVQDHPVRCAVGPGQQEGADHVVDVNVVAQLVAIPVDRKHEAVNGLMDEEVDDSVAILSLPLERTIRIGDPQDHGR